MDCKTARLFLYFDRPRAGELDRAEADALQAHLASCLDCAATARPEQALDVHLGRAMRAVEVPEGLRGRLLERLAAERDATYRRWIGHGLRVVAAAAALVLLTWGAVWWWYGHVKPGLDLADVFQQKNLKTFDADAVRAGFARMGVKTGVPANLNYSFLTEYGLSELPGHEGKVVVPQLIFNHGKRRAVVYIVSDRQFKLESLDGPHAVPADGYAYKLDVLPPFKSAGGRFACLIFYTGSDDGWLRQSGDDRAG
jgi:hypothetical protein